MKTTIKRLADYVAEQTTRLAAPMLKTHESYQSIFTADGTPVATISRPRAIGDAWGLFILSDTDAGMIAAFSSNPSHASIVGAMRAMARTGKELPGMSLADLRQELTDSEARAQRTMARAHEYSTQWGVAGALTNAARARYKAELCRDLIKQGEQELESILQKARPAPATIDMTPTWSGLMPALIAVLQNGNSEGKTIARQELMRLAHEVDAANVPARARSLSAAVNPDAPVRPSRALSRPAAAPCYDMRAHDLAPTPRASGGWPLWAFDPEPIEEMTAPDVAHVWGLGA